MKNWTFEYNGYNPENEKLREALCTLGNGYFASRGASSEEDADQHHYPGTYLAGEYNRLETEISGNVIENEDLFNLPNWLPLKFRINGGDWFALSKVEILSYHQKLELKEGILQRSVTFRTPKGEETTLENRRFVHMQKRHFAGLETSIEAQNWSGEIEFLSALDGTVINAGVERYSDLNSKHLEPLENSRINNNSIFLSVKTNQSQIEIAQAARTDIYTASGRATPESETLVRDGYIEQRFRIKIDKGETLRAEKIVTLYTSKDDAISQCGLQAKNLLQRAPDFSSLLESHALAWDHLWRRFEVDFKSSNHHSGEDTAIILRLYTFHLLQTTSMHSMDLDVGVPSRGWHGEAYRGHIFWDEIFIFPMLNLRMPEITRSLLMYRYRRLEEARHAASEKGFSGAMYPWQSGSSGREESQVIHLNPKSGEWVPDNSSLQRHVNAAIAYNIWHYYQVTADIEFMSFYGAEMFLEIARFWGSITNWNEKEERYEIKGVMGPDEYHDGYPDSDKPGLDNNSYTNVMVVWLFKRARDIFKILSKTECEQVCEKIGLDQSEVDYWMDITKKIKIPFHGQGIISQFEGYEKLEEFDWEGYREKYDDIQRLDRILGAENDTPNRFKASKQADVLMLFYLFSAEELKEIFEGLGYEFDPDMIPRNVEYYLQRTSHGSTLSRIVHSWVLARSNRTRSWEMFKEALESDVSDIQGGTTPEGIHLGAMAGSVDIMQRAYTGIETRNGMLHFNPAIPEELGRLHMHIRYRGIPMEITITPEKMVIKTLPYYTEPVRISFRGQVAHIEPEGECIQEFGLS